MLSLVSTHLYFVAYYVSLVQVPRLLEDEPVWVVGLVVGALGLAGMVARPLTGVLADRGRREPWLAAGAAATALAMAGFALSANPWWMFASRLLQGVGMALFTTVLLATVTTLVPQRRMGLGLGLYQSSNSVTQLYAAALAVWLSQVTSFELVFMAAAAAAALSLVSSVLIRAPPLAPLPPLPWRQREWISRTGLVPALIFLTMTTTMGAVGAFLPLFAEERSLGNVGLFYTAFSFSLLSSRALAGALSDRVGRGPVLVPALLAGAAAMGLLATTQSQAALLLVAVVYGAGFGAVQVMAAAMVADRTPAYAAAAGAATYTVAWDVGGLFGSILLGVVAQATSYAATFALCALLPLGGLALYFVRLRARPFEAGASSPAAGGDSASSLGPS